MRHWPAITTFAVAAFVTLTQNQDPVDPRQEAVPPSDAEATQGDLPWSMRQKLGHAQGLLEGLVINNFDTVAEHAQQISVLTLDDNWRLIQTQEYYERSMEFRRTVDQINRMARQENLDGAKLAYLTLIHQCFQCHEYVRNPEVK